MARFEAEGTWFDPREVVMRAAREAVKRAARYTVGGAKCHPAIANALLDHFASGELYSRGDPHTSDWGRVLSIDPGGAEFGCLVEMAGPDVIRVVKSWSKKMEDRPVSVRINQWGSSYTYHAAATAVTITTPAGTKITADEALKACGELATVRAAIPMLGSIDSAGPAVAALVRDADQYNKKYWCEQVEHARTKEVLERQLRDAVSERDDARSTKEMYRRRADEASAEVSRIRAELFEQGRRYEAQLRDLRNRIPATIPAPAVTPDTPVTLGMLRDLHSEASALQNGSAAPTPIMRAVDRKLGR